jgi:hypothetical protein
MAKIIGHGRYLHRKTSLQWFAPLLKSWEIVSNPGATIQVLEQVSDNGNKTMNLLGTLDDLDNARQREAYKGSPQFIEVTEGRVARECLNLGSYNYLGFADDWKITCKDDVLGSLKNLPVSSSSCRNEFGTAVLHREVEKAVARFCGKEDALALNMGFNANCTPIPSLVGRGDLVISDELNHTSIVNGARASGSAMKEAIIMGHPRTRLRRRVPRWKSGKFDLCGRQRQFLASIYIPLMGYPIVNNMVGLTCWLSKENTVGLTRWLSKEPF